MKNYAGDPDKDEEIAKELELAGIKVTKMPEHWRTRDPEMRTIIIGELGPWGFIRAWYYWVARGPGILAEVAEELHKTHGKEVRVDVIVGVHLRASGLKVLQLIILSCG